MPDGLEKAPINTWPTLSRIMAELSPVLILEAVSWIDCPKIGEIQKSDNTISFFMERT